MKSNRLVITMTGFLVLVITTNALAQDWSQWRGANRDGKVTNFDTPESWPSELTRQWTVNIGLGDASPVMVGDRLYSFTRQGDNEVILCLEGATGKEIWKYQYPALAITGPASSQHPGPRSTPTVGEGKIIAFGVGGVLSCLDAGTGKLAWKNEEFTKDLPPFFTSLSPLIFNGMCMKNKSWT